MHAEGGSVTTDEKPPYTIHSPTKVTLSALARELAREYFPSADPRESEKLMAKHILAQENLRASGETQRQGEN